MDCSQKEKKENRCLVSVYVLLGRNCKKRAGDVHAKLLFCQSNLLLSAVVVAVVVVVVVAIVLVVGSAPFVARSLSSLLRLKNE